jgi:hypothetical protein
VIACCRIASKRVSVEAANYRLAVWTYVQLLGSLAQGSVVLLDKEPGNLILAKVVVVGRSTRLLGGR